jgi:hypothetical protein
MKTFYDIPWWDLYFGLYPENYERHGNSAPNVKVISSSQRWGIVREWRNFLLTESDWSQLPDAPLSDEEVLRWQEYRQELRNIPQDFKNPINVTFPNTP